MTTSDQPTRPPSLIDVEILDLGPLYQQAVQHYISLKPERAQWSAEKCARIKIRTECRWGRVQLEDQGLYMINEKGEGPREPLSTVVRAYVALFAEMPACAGDPGFFEMEPFCKVPIDKAAAQTFLSLGLVALEDFVRAKIPEMEEAYDQWLSVLRNARERARQSRQRVHS